MKLGLEAGADITVNPLKGDPSYPFLFYIFLSSLSILPFLLFYLLDFPTFLQGRVGLVTVPFSYLSTDLLKKLFESFIDDR